MPLSITVAAFSLAALLQQAPENSTWLAFADTLSRSTDTRQLKHTADQLRRQRDYRSRLRAGLMYHRIYEIEHQQAAFDRAAGLLKDALGKAPNLPAIYYLAGRALVSGPHVTERNGIVTMKVLRGVMGSSERERGIAALESALQYDATFLPAALELGRQAVRYRDADELRAARKALRPIVERSGDEQARVLLAEVERHLGNPIAAAASLDSGRAGPASTSPAGVEYQRAMALMLVNDRAADGAAAYWRGTNSLDAQTAQAYFDDLSYIASHADRESWRNTPLSEKAAWLKRFWSLQAARSGITVDERVITHYQRLAHARERYPRRPSLIGRSNARSPSQGMGSREIVDDVDAYRRDIDDRGLIWVKYGEPDHRITAGLQFEGWVYERDDGNLNFFFTVPAPKAAAGDDGYSLFSGVPECYDAGADFIRHAAQYEPELQKIYTGVCTNRSPSPLAGRSVAATLVERARENLRHNDARPRFERDVPFHYSLYTLDAPREASTVVAAVAIPADRLTRNGGTYRVRASLIVTDTVTGTVARTDTTLVLSPDRALGSNDYVRTYLQLTTRPSTATIYRVSVIDANAERAGRIYGGARQVDAFDGRLALSDLILADTGTAGGWKRGTAALDLVPMEEYPGGAFNLFYEIYNLPAGSYRTQVRIEAMDGATRRLLERILGGDRTRIELAFDGRIGSAQQTMQELRQVGTDLPEGRYRITVQVTDARGAQAERTRILRVSRAGR